MEACNIELSRGNHSSRRKDDQSYLKNDWKDTTLLIFKLIDQSVIEKRNCLVYLAC